MPEDYTYWKLVNYLEARHEIAGTVKLPGGSKDPPGQLDARFSALLGLSTLQEA